ncbi:MAG: hypothetical protein QOF12_1580 [Solirubrobacteraceae bacterium]|jgi:hypothetical protein|nr:hypothetical protein [Solirubrobacteraceae bacterium]
MGLLDDAIREHLELKRRRGADSTEVTRQEQEAFGPPRRTEFEVAPADGYAHDEPVLDEPAAAIAAEQPTELHALEETPPVVQSEPPRPHGDPADALPPAESAAAPPPPPPVHEPVQPTREFDAGELRAATAPEPEAEPEAEAAVPPAPRADEEQSSEDPEEADVLEETPEFLQETPEHDRLWFEQRPPRDFDF